MENNNKSNRTENQGMEAQGQERPKIQQGAQEIGQKWEREAEALKKIYPRFDLKTALQNADFKALLRSGAKMQKAYEVGCFEEIKEAIVRETEARVLAQVRQNGARPKENGVSGQRGSGVTESVKSLTPAQRAEIAKKAQKGQRISFGA